jgi:hypothetical protein
MAKFDKDEFIRDLNDKVREAIESEVLSSEDIKNNDVERLKNFIQYIISEYINNRKAAIDVIKDFNYDERFNWDKLESTYGKFKSLIDIALVNLWKFLESQGMLTYSYFMNGETAEAAKPGEQVSYTDDEFDDDEIDDEFDDDINPDYDDSFDEQIYDNNEDEDDSDMENLDDNDFEDEDEVEESFNRKYRRRY